MSEIKNHKVKFAKATQAYNTHPSWLLDRKGFPVFKDQKFVVSPSQKYVWPVSKMNNVVESFWNKFLGSHT